MIGRSLLPGLNMLPGANAMPGAQAPSPNGGFDLLELLSSPGMQLSMSALGASEPGGGGWQAMAYAAPQIAAQHKQKQRDEALAAAMSEMFGDNPQQAELARMFPEQAAQHAFGQAFPEPSDPYTLGPGQRRFDGANQEVASAPFRPDDEGMMVFGADGNPVFARGNTALLRGAQQFNNQQLAGAREQADQAGQIAPLLDNAQRILDSGFDSGFGRDVTGNAQRAYGALGDATQQLLGRDLPGAEGARESGAQFEEFQAVSRELGARALSLFGGSDTERELMVAIQTNPGPTYHPDTNRSILDRKIRATRILMDKPVVQAQFNATYPGGMTPDGQTWDLYWRRYQQQLFGSDLQATNAQTGEAVPTPDANDPLGLRQ